MAQKRNVPHGVPDPTFENLEGVQTLGTSLTKFALNSYGHMANQSDGNVFFSPASIATALSMVYAGARGKCAEEMASTLQISDFGENVHELIRDFFDAINNVDSTATGYILKSANRLFAEQQYTFLDEYILKCQKFYHAEAKSMDFKNDAEGSRNYINQWTEEQTENKITNLIPEGLVDHLTRMVLVNAIYFKGNWSKPFEKEHTTKATFYSPAGEVSVDMMKMVSSSIRSSGSKELDCKIVDLDYGNKQMSMTIILPNKRDGLPELEQKLNHENLSKALKELYSSLKVTLHLPRFKIEYEQNLNEMLKKSGMPLVFSNMADLSGLDGTNNLQLSAVVHKAFVEVNEEGTEAAAATAAIVMMRSMPMSMDVRCDHPFLFFIRERASDMILFMGRINNPIA